MMYTWAPQPDKASLSTALSSACDSVSNSSSGPWGEKVSITDCKMHRQKPYQIRLPQPLAHSKELITGRARNDKVLGEINAANTVKAADERFPRSLVYASHHRADKIGTEAALVQAGADQAGHGLWADVSLFSQTIHVDFVAEEVADGGDVGGQAGEAEIDAVREGEDLGHIVGHGKSLHA